MPKDYRPRGLPFAREIQHNPPEQRGAQDPVPGRSSKRYATWNTELCDRCNELRLDSFLSEVGYGMHQPRDHAGVLVSNLGHHEDWSSTCALCKIFLYAAARIKSGPGFYMLRLLTRRWADQDLQNVPEGHITDLDRPLLAVTGNVDKDSCHTGDLSFDLRPSGYISWSWRDATGALTGQGKLINETAVDFSLISRWLQFCQEHHKELCTTPTGEPVRGFQLIDCLGGSKIVPATRDMQYLALSYVWGANASSDAMVRGKLLWGRLPQTVRDAIDATKKLGFRYLWVDRYCIPDDSQVKHTQIMQMDLIYARAQATILAAAGIGADHGLPGIGRCARSEQPAAMVGEYSVFSTLSDPHLTIGRSTWNTRGWTYQEAMLSGRRIFFTQEQVYWECRSMQCVEALPPRLMDWHEPSMEMYYKDARNEMFELSTLDMSLFDIWKYIAAYSWRKLSYDDDALNGFLGVLGYLQTPKTTLRHFWGIPIPMKADHRSVFGAWHPRHCFLLALTWSPHVKYRPQRHTKARRRPGFPSWSWAGWECDLSAYGITHCYQGCTCDFDEPRTPTVSFAETADGTLLSWDNLQARLLDRSAPLSSIPRIIVLKVHTVQLRIKHMPRGAVVQHPGYYAYYALGDAHVGNIQFRDCVAYAVLELTDQSDELKARIEREQFTGALLGCYRREREAFVLLLDEKAGGIHERIGTLALASLPTFNGVMVRSTGSFSVTASGRGRTSTTPTSATLEDWKLKKTWRTLRIQ